ncbi:MAG: hypothetical protein QXF82_10115 [Nitrososphaeria archaeon]
MSQREIREKRIQILTTIAVEDWKYRAIPWEEIKKHLFLTARLNWNLSTYAAKDIADLAVQKAQAQLEKEQVEGERHE